METEIFRGTHAVLRGSNLDSRSDVIFIVFQSWVQNPTLDQHGYGRVLFISRGIPALYITSSQNDWYQSADAVTAVIHAAQVAQKFGRRITYGSSMGGYAAINFANDLDAHACISIMPQFSIDRSKVPFEERWAVEASRINFFNDKIHLFRANRIYAAVLYDRLFRQDQMQVRIIEEYTERDAISLPMTGHSGPDAIVLKDIIAAASKGDFDSIPMSARQSHRNVRKNGGTYYLQIARLARSLTWESRLQILKRGEAIEPNNTKISLEISRVLLGALQNEKALEVQLKFISSHPDIADFYSHSGVALSRLGMMDDALGAVDKALLLGPQVAYYHHQKADLLNRTGKPAEAIKAQHAALSLEPTNPTYIQHMQQLQSRI